MKSLLQFLLGTLFLAITAAATGDVTVLSASNFDDFIQKNPVALVKFMAPWCGHCKRLAPEYEQAATELKKVNIPLAEVDATVDQELAQKYNVQGFPTMFLFRDGKDEPYNGGRTAATIVDWVKKMTGPALTWVDDVKQAEETGSKASTRFVGVFSSKDSAEAKLFEEAAKLRRMKGTFVAYVNKDAKEAKLTINRPDETPAEHIIKEKGDLMNFIGEESFPLFGVVNGENYGDYAARSKSWVWFAGSREDFEKVAPEVRKVSKDYRTVFNFVWLDTEMHKQHAEHMLGLTETPGFAIIHDEAKYHYPGDALAANQKELAKFIEKVKAGKVKRFLKSEPIPEKNDEPVKVVVGQTFSEMVLQKDTDVFLKIYAPWCGHCKKLAPIYDEFAQRLEGNKHFMVAKFDGTANEPDVSGFEYKGFPTLFFVKAGSKEPIPYEGERTAEGLIAFAKSHSSKPLTVKDAPKPAESEEDKDEL